MAWLGDTDLRASAGEEGNAGPIAAAVGALALRRVVLLSDRDPAVSFRLKQGGVEVQPARYQRWLQERSGLEVELVHAPLSSPTSYRDIYQAARREVERVRAGDKSLVFHVSPGTPAMGAVWLLLAKTHTPAMLIEGSAERGIQPVEFPFELSAELLEEAVRRRGEALRELAAGQAPEEGAFEHIVHRSNGMKQLLARARRAAAHDVPVLIEGESGTGKELLARAIHQQSPRAKGAFVAVNCGAIPEGLFEAEFFGHSKGAFTGAERERKGYFERASGGTLFLDEVGELPAAAQVKLLRALQQGEVVRVGTAEPIAVNVRVLAATNRPLLEAVVAGDFREDLFFRLAVATLRVPPLRQREGDLGLLLDRTLEEMNRILRPGTRPRQLSPGARTVFLRYPWPGNVRELRNTVQRAVLWSDGAVIEAAEATEALLDVRREAPGSLLNRPIGGEFRLGDVLGELARHYLERALEEAGGNKTRAAALLGLRNYQTLTNWLEKYDVPIAPRKR